MGFLDPPWPLEHHKLPSQHSVTRQQSQTQNKAIDWLLANTCPKEPIFALYFESENEIKFYNLEARSPIWLYAGEPMMACLKLSTAYSKDYVYEPHREAIRSHLLCMQKSKIKKTKENKHVARA